MISFRLFADEIAELIDKRPGVLWPVIGDRAAILFDFEKRDYKNQYSYDASLLFSWLSTLFAQDITPSQKCAFTRQFCKHVIPDDKKADLDRILDRFNREVDAELVDAHFVSKVEAMDQSAGRQRDLEMFVQSARGETSTPDFAKWAGGERVTLAIVFTDVVGSTALGEELKDEPMNEVRRAHFAQSRKLIDQYKGREIKTIGDSFMAAFRNVVNALDYARDLKANSGHVKVQIRAGIHIGPMQVDENDLFGGAVNFAARVVGTIKGAEIWLSDQAKVDLDSSGARQHAQLRWERHDRVGMKDLTGAFTLWSMSE